MPRADFDSLFSELTNSAQVLTTSTHVRRELGKLLADVVRLENAANRIVRTLRQLQPSAHDR
jgi:hypothetical protein